MPTFYTAKIKNGISFSDFALGCARSFGACYSLRDEPGGGDAIPAAFVPDGYHLEKAAEAEAEYDRFLCLTPDAQREMWARECREVEDSRRRILDSARELRLRYLEMLREVRNWSPPTPEHAPLKQFMQEQLEASIKFDCVACEVEEPPAFEAWLADKLAWLRGNIIHHKTEYDREVNLAARNTQWVRALRESLAGQVDTGGGAR